MSKSMVLAVFFVAVFTTLLLPRRAQAFPETTTGSVTLIGTVSCSKCQGIQPLHKGYTRWTWALHSVNDGDEVVLVVGKTTYKLQGEKGQLLKYMESKAKVTGSLDGQTLAVQVITAADRKR